MAEVQIKATHIIKPEEKTWTGTMKLSEFDMVVAKGYIPMLYLYEPNKDWVDPAAISTTLRESLGKVLVHLYPLVGRLKPLEGRRLELEVDEATWGIPLVEAEAAVEMAELGDLAEAEDKGRLQHLFPVVKSITATAMERDESSEEVIQNLVQDYEINEETRKGTCFIH